jgi:hypothetical protein
MMEFFMQNQVLILGALLAVSEVMGANPAIKANGLFDALVKIIKYFAPKKA